MANDFILLSAGRLLLRFSLQEAKCQTLQNINQVEHSRKMILSRTHKHNCTLSYAFLTVMRHFLAQRAKGLVPFSPLETTGKMKANLWSPPQYLTGYSVQTLCRSGLFVEFAHF